MESPKVEITVIPNGPIQVKCDEVDFIGVDGTKTVKKGTFYLCRCGHSKNKPLCDGNHTAEGFTD